MGFDDLRSILLTERETGKLIQISPDIFDRTHVEIADLLKKVYAIEDPLSEEARALIEETIAIKETMHELFAIRSRKILALALMHAEGNYYDREEVKRMLRPSTGCLTGLLPDFWNARISFFTMKNYLLSLRHQQHLQKSR